MTCERILIGILLALLLWFGAVIERLENYHYASQLGFCGEFTAPRFLPEREQCLTKIKTRTSAWWHLYYALTD